MMVIALLMVAVPVIMLLVAFGVLSSELINQYTNYKSGVEALGNLQMSDFNQQVRTIVAIVSGLVAILALILLLRELTFGRRLTREVIVEGTPGQETVIKTSAVSSLVENSARRAGAQPSKVNLSSKDNTYSVDCKIQVPESGNFTEISTRTKENIENALDRYGVSYRSIEVTVQGTNS
jgi:hypothetical protein